MCDDIVIIPSDSTMTEALIALADFMCGCCGGTHTPISYNCLTGVCFDPGDGTGIYPTLAACQTVCTDPTQPSWNCVNGACINPGNGSGQYLSLSACQTACVPPPVTYNCVNSTCVNPGDGTGMYGTLAQCQQFCEDVYESYDCFNGVCSDPGDGSGVYPTLVACDAACTFPPANISFNCLNGNCTDPGDGSGVYPTLLACNTACTSPTPNISYNCFLGQCTDPGNGSGVYPTLLACQTACVPIAPISYNCVSGNCVDPGNGLGLYPTLNACEVVCNPTPPVTPCVTDCELVIQAPLPGTTLVYSAYTITSTSSYTPLYFFNPSQLLPCTLQNIFSGTVWFDWGFGPLFPGGPFVDIPFTYTLNFSSPINNVYILLHGYSAISAPNPNPPDAESFVFTTNAGFVDITCADYCCATITGGNTVTAMSGPGINCLADVYCIPGTCNGSGAFIISSSLPYTSLTITGSGGVAGINIGLCEAQFGTSNTSTIYTTFDALPIPAVSYNCVNCLCNSVTGSGGTYATLGDCVLSGCNDTFTTTWETTTAGESITLPYYALGIYAGTIDWGDSTTSANSFATSTHIYATPGIYTVTICGRIAGWNFSTTSTSVLKIKSVVQWGQLTLGNDTGGYFVNCANLDLSSVTDTLNLFGTGITNFQNMFLGCTSLTTINNINFWDTSAIIGMPGMFSGCSLFNQALSFDTSLVTDMSLMFQNCTVFNSALTFNTLAVTSMISMFQSCIAFDSPLTFTSTAAVTTMNSMFQSCNNFNQPLNFNTVSVIDMGSMFRDATAFNQPLIFNTVAVTNMANMFQDAPAFQQDISSWNISNVINFGLFMFGKTPATWPTTYFDNLLCQWSLQTVTPLIIIDFGTANYTNATGGPCRTVLQSPPKNWAINSGPGV
jgi:surface protein